jgi:hypothetical protein
MRDYNVKMLKAEIIYKCFVLLESGVYKILRMDPTSKIVRKTQKLFTKHKTVLPAAWKYKLTSYYSKPPHLYGLPKIHKPDIPLRPMVSSTDSPCYALAEFLHNTLSHLTVKTCSFVKASEHFIKSIQDINLQIEVYLVSFDVSLFTNVPVEEVLQVIRNRLSTDPFFPERTSLQVEDMMELLDISLTTTYFQSEDKSWEQKDSIAMGNIISGAQ